MNALWPAAFVLGMAGSAHCIGMCGPIALAVPFMGPDRRSRLLSTALLNGGRLISYGTLGLAFGAFGEGLRLAGLQQWVSLLAGTLLLIAAFAPALLERMGTQGRLAMLISRIRGTLARHFRRTAPEAIFFTGILNGLLPCGLVYAAAIGAAATSSATHGALFMLLFGAGTLPALVALRLGSGLIGTNARAYLRRLSPVVVAAMGLLLILRGSRLDIPYVSPGAPATPVAITACP